MHGWGKPQETACWEWEHLSHDGRVWLELLQERCFLDEIEAEHAQGLGLEGWSGFWGKHF